MEEDKGGMSLLSEAMTSCTLLTETRTADGYGGYTASWTDGDGFSAAIVLDSSGADSRAQAAAVVNKYTVTTSKAVTLSFHDVFRRESDEKIFRVISDGDDKHTPASAGLDMRQVQAEEWRIPDDD
ncbi:MAG: hypothetical protein K5637_01965 [Lachnospiraceae bacterium]|nr:hypothetical protein [Lachnospiraceae bacterium]